MSASTVTKVSASDEWRALCSCKWEGPDRIKRSDAYRDQNHHAKECPEKVEK